jgi:hypothetical protein
MSRGTKDRGSNCHEVRKSVLRWSDNSMDVSYGMKCLLIGLWLGQIANAPVSLHLWDNHCASRIGKSVLPHPSIDCKVMNIYKYILYSTVYVQHT